MFNFWLPGLGQALAADVPAWTDRPEPACCSSTLRDVVGSVADRPAPQPSEPAGLPSFSRSIVCLVGMVLLQAASCCSRANPRSCRALASIAVFGTSDRWDYVVMCQMLRTEQTGRVSTAVNTLTLVGAFLVQAAIGLDPRSCRAPLGWLDPDGYSWALALTAAFQAARCARDGDCPPTRACHFNVMPKRQRSASSHAYRLSALGLSTDGQRRESRTTTSSVNRVQHGAAQLPAIARVAGFTGQTGLTTSTRPTRRTTCRCVWPYRRYRRRPRQSVAARSWWAAHSSRALPRVRVPPSGCACRRFALEPMGCSASQPSNGRSMSARERARTPGRAGKISS